MDPAQYLLAKNELKQIIRGFFNDNQFTEVETPILVPCPGAELHMDYFATTYHDLQKRAKQLYLRSSPELHLKKILSMGIKNIYEFAPCFRNGGEWGEWHRPEFTMLEYYQTDTTFLDFMNFTDQLLKSCAQKFSKCDGTIVKILNSSPEKISVFESFQTFAGITLVDQDHELAKKAVAAGVLSVHAQDDFETAFFKILIEKIEPQLKLQKYCILYDFPVSQAVLARTGKAQDSAQTVAKRFEIYLMGQELCNAYWEENNTVEIKKRFMQTNLMRADLQKEILPLDFDFINSTNQMPDCCGNALGFDRLLAILLSEKNLDQITLFSHRFNL